MANEVYEAIENLIEACGFKTDEVVAIEFVAGEPGKVHVVNADRKTATVKTVEYE